MVLAGTLLIALALLPTGAAAQEPSGTTLAGAELPRAAVVVDAETGEVLSAHNAREPLGVASTAKLLSALVASSRLEGDLLVPVSARAAGMPALKLTLKTGERWRADHLLHAMLLCSCNDAAVALAEAAGGSLEGFAELMDTAAEGLGLADQPVLRDPAGLDDEFSFDGGNRISARDLAIVTRAFLADEQLARMVALPEYRFDGGDGEPHSVKNHNRLLTSYPGAIGVKTGYTRRAGYSLVAAARRSGRTLIAVVVGSPSMYAQASELLDRGFASSSDEPDGDVLPPLPGLEDASDVSTPTSSVLAPDPAPAARGEAAGAGGDGLGLGLGQRVLIVFGVAVLAVVVRRRQVVRRRARRRLAAQRARLARQRADLAAQKGYRPRSVQPASSGGGSASARH